MVSPGVNRTLRSRHGAAPLPACVHGQVFGVVRVLLILLEVELGQQLTGFGHGVLHSTVQESLIRTIDLQHSTSFTKKKLTQC